MEENLNMKDHMGMIPVRMDSPWAMCVKEKRCQQMAENEANYGSNMIVANLEKGSSMGLKYDRSQLWFEIGLNFK